MPDRYSPGFLFLKTSVCLIYCCRPGPHAVFREINISERGVMKKIKRMMAIAIAITNNRATQKYGKQMQGKRSFLASYLSGFKQPRNKYTAPAKRGKSKILLFSRIESDERRAQSFDEMGNEHLKHDKRRVIWKTILLSKERRHSV